MFPVSQKTRSNACMLKPRLTIFVTLAYVTAHVAQILVTNIFINHLSQQKEKTKSSCQ